MKRTALIAAVVSVIPLLAGAVSANADPYNRYGYGRHVPAYGYGHGYTVRRPHVDRFHYRRHWAPLPPWRRWHGRYGWR